MIHMAKLSPTPASAELDGVSLNFILHTQPPPTAHPPGQVNFLFVIKQKPYCTIPKIKKSLPTLIHVLLVELSL